MKYSNFIKRIKNQSNTEEEISTLNPLFHDKLKKFDLLEYSKSRDFNINQLLNGECCICYKKFIECQSVCLPFNCNHIFCYSCFCDYCKCTRKSYKYAKSICDYIFCPLCRKDVCLDWKLSKKFYCFKDNINNQEIGIAYASSISDIYSNY